MAGWPDWLGGKIVQIGLKARWLGGQIGWKVRLAGKPDWLGSQIGQIGWEGHIGCEGQIVLGGQMGGPGWPDWLGSQTGLNLILHLVNKSTLSTKRLS